MKQYQKQRNPLAGHLINSKPQARKFLNQLLQEHGEGLMFNEIMNKTVPYEGRLALRKGRITQYLRNDPELYQEKDGRWYHVHSRYYNTKHEEGGGVL